MPEQGRPRYAHWCERCLDFHAHFMHPEVYAACAPHSVATGFGKQLIPPDLPAMQAMFDPERQIDGMDERGIDVHVISACDVIISRSWAEPAEELRLTRLINDTAAEWVSRHPERFIGSFALPLGDMDAALAEAERCIDMGLRVANLPSNHRGRYLGDRRYEALWAEFRRHDVVTFIHPDGVRDPWFQDYAMWNSIGQSIEEVRVMSSLIYEGVMDRHRGVKIVMAHGGGYMPHYMGRLDRNVTDKPHTTRNLSKLPSEYLRDFYYDSCVYDPRTLELLVERVGIERVVLGGDYPVAAMHPLELLERATGLDDAQRAAIAGGNALALLGVGLGLGLGESGKLQASRTAQAPAAI